MTILLFTTFGALLLPGLDLEIMRLKAFDTFEVYTATFFLKNNSLGQDIE